MKINTNPTPKKQKKINRETYWMYKIQDWAWGKNNVKTYRGYCPLFWMTWLTLAAAPLILIGKCLEFSWGVIMELASNSKYSTQENKPEKIPTSKPSDFLIVLVFEQIRDNYKKWKERRNEGEDSKEEDFIYQLYFETNMSGREREWFLNTPNWKDLYPFLKEKEEKQKIREAAQKAARDKMQVKINTIVSKTSWMVKPTICLSAVVLAYYLYRIVSYLFSSLLGWAQDFFTWDFVKSCGSVVILVIVAVLVIGFLAKMFQVIKEKLNSIPDSPKIQEIKQEFWLTQIIRTSINFVIEAFSFVKDTIRMLYKKECPLIVYGDENSGIEKHENPPESKD